jgi:hypothetical protein
MNTCVVGIKDIFARFVVEREGALKRAAEAEARANQVGDLGAEPWTGCLVRAGPMLV